MSAQVPFAIALYALCSSSLLIINKLAVEALRSATMVLLFQLAFSAFSVAALGTVIPKSVEVEALRWDKVKAFLGVVAIFSVCLFSNLKVLQHANVEAVIVFRSCSPIAVSFLDYKYLGRELPNVQTFLSMLGIVAGAVIYMLSDKGMHMDGIFWISVYYVSIVIEMAFVKYIVDTIPMSTWTRVYYNNILSIPFVILFGLLTGGFDSTVSAKPTVSSTAWLWLGLAGVVGFLISYAGFQLRKLVSATSFTIVGVLCKLGTMLINHFVSENRATLMGYLGLCFCIFAGCFYQQADKRVVKPTTQDAAELGASGYKE